MQASYFKLIDIVEKFIYNSVISKVSLIVPVYNVEKYIARCLDYCINQTYSNIEIICINDGSTDGSLSILCEYAKRDKRIKVITQKNGGAGSARNNGIEQASGEYVSFIDSDDWTYLTLYETFVKAISKGKYYEQMRSQLARAYNKGLRPEIARQLAGFKIFEIAMNADLETFKKALSVHAR